MTAHPFDREEALDQLSEGPFDVLVIGGGITGAGVALDAASRGLRTALVERRDFGSGTSSRSSKLVHGGIRYLQQREVGLVYESLAERQRLLDNAPHLVTPLEFLIPLFGKGGVVDSAVARAYSSALWTYDLTGGVRIGRRHRRIGADEVLRLMPTLRTDRLVAGFIYYDARTDDARLTLAIARTAADYGAAVVNYARATQLLKASNGRVSGAVVHAEDPVRRTGCDIEVRASAVVNATGVWADDVRALDEGHDPHSLRPAKGIHISVERAKLPCEVATVLPVPRDRRSIFVVPWDGEVYIGTTDTDYSGELEEPECSESDIEYLLDAVNLAVSRPLSASDVTSAWAGLRPLASGGSERAAVPRWVAGSRWGGGSKGASGSERTADLSRRHRIQTSPSGLVSVIGGKLTTYRKMAEDTVDRVVRLTGLGSRRCCTKRLPIHGCAGTATLRQPQAAERLAIGPEELDHLVSRHGGEALDVLAIARSRPQLDAPLVPGMPYSKAEAIYAVRNEMALTLEDVLSRRTRALLRNREAALAAAPEVAALVASELGWTEAEISSQLAPVMA